MTAANPPLFSLIPIKSTPQAYDDESLPQPNSFRFSRKPGMLSRLHHWMDFDSALMVLKPCGVEYEALPSRTTRFRRRKLPGATWGAFNPFEKVKILIFDEKNAGKEALRRNGLNDDALEDFVFVTGQSLRQAICLLSTDCIRLIFGPCTGLLHCASGIYNFFVQS
jgi:hypothetical protein